ncbi:unnamed protein product [Medioppia subpectinata]|uniref:Transmembrane and coiled-coil domains protein 1 n=1 Tax=Medioppia subpectinata TaxID=1979941 RepID=A0A7R9KPK7_9ACAR|nr:unnamed protein product [Medioppia subpectinata]CAG2107138.1 unnamed protein product [Medioppia subpectinata]
MKFLVLSVEKKKEKKRTRMKRNKSPGISQRGYVSSNDSGSSNDVQPKPPNNTRIKQHTRGFSQGSYTPQDMAHTLGRTSNSSAEDHLNSNDNNTAANNHRELATHSANLCTNGSGGEVTAIQSSLQNFSSTDELDSLLPHSSDAQRTRALIEHFHTKIIRTKESIKTEQNSRDENVNEYLKLAANADKNQLTRIKSVFEKKNQKSAQTIAHLQKKLDNYNKKIKETEARGLSAGHHKQTREMLRDFGQGLKDVGVNIKEGVTGLSGGVFGVIHSAGETVMTKPKEFFKNRFASTENVSSAEKTNEETVGAVSGATNADIECGDTTTGNKYGVSGGQTGGHFALSATAFEIILQPKAVLQASTHLPPPPDTAVTPTALIDMEQIVIELKERREECRRMSEDVDSLKSQLQNECSVFHQSLQEERYRFERLEEQMNDLIELHQNEIENLKQNMVDMEEKVQYQSEERLRDVHEMLESCQTRISRMEHQQHQHLQQLVNLDSLENSNARALVLKLINVVLTILQVVLLLVATIANILAPFLQTRLRMVTSIIVLFVCMVLFQQWPDFGSWTRRKISENWIHYSSTLDSDFYQQHQHLQQLVNLDSLENSNARALVLKLINVVLTILQVVLLLVATIANILAPFLQTRLRMVTSIIVLFVCMVLFQQWPDFGSWTRRKISENWIHYSSTLDSG